jgi:hypothetical protein
LRVKAHTAHFCLYNRNSYNKIIEALESAEVPIDEVYRTDPALRLFCTVPHLAKQRPGKSDIESTETNYTHMFDRANEELFKAVDQQLEGFLNENRTFYKKIVIADVLTVACIIAMYLFLPR